MTRGFLIISSRVIGAGAFTGGLITGLKETYHFIDDHHLTTIINKPILEPMACVSAIFIRNFAIGCVHGTLITVTLPIVGPMYLYKQFRTNKSDVRQLFDRFTP